MRAIMLAALAALLPALAWAQEITPPMMMPNAPTRFCAPVTATVTPGLIVGIKRVTIPYACARVGDEVTIYPPAASTLTVQVAMYPHGEVLTDGVVTVTFQAVALAGLTLGAQQVRMRAQGY